MKRKPVTWACVWAGWGLYFAVAEWAALRTGEPHAPLTYHMRHTLGIRKRPVHYRSGQIALASGAVWLAHHLYRGAVDSGVSS
jgi:hypothetical protein